MVNCSPSSQLHTIATILHYIWHIMKETGEIIQQAMEESSLFKKLRV